MAPKVNPPNPAKKAEFNQKIAKKIRDYAKENFVGATLKMKDGCLIYSQEQNIIVGRSFTGVYVNDIAAPYYEFTDDDEIAAGLRCDGGRDLGIDFGYWKNGCLHIFQTKYIGNGGNLARADMLDFVGIDARIRDSENVAEANSEVRDLLQNFNSATPVRYILVTNGAMSPQVQREFNEKRGELGREMWIFDWKKIFDQYEEAKHRKPSDSVRMPTVRIPIRAIGGNSGYIDLSSSLLIGEGRPRGTVVLVARGDDVKNLFATHGQSLFHANVRGHLGSGGRINKGMTDTLKNDPDLFYLYNNGMSALCSDLKIHGGAGAGELECRDFQIINGAQTASTIGKFPNLTALKKANVLLRITNTGEAGGKDTGLSHGIILANNSQNVIRVSDFHANDDIQESLQKSFGKMRFPIPVSTGVWYIPKRGIPMPPRIPSTPKPKELKMETLAKALYAYSDKWDNPSKLYSTSSFLFGTEGDGVYWDLFGDAQGNVVKALSEQEERRIIAIGFLQMYIEHRLKEHRKPLEDVRHSSVQYMSYCAGWHFLWAFGCALRRFHPDHEDEIYRKIIKGDGFKSGGFVEQWVDSIAEIIQNALDYESDPDAGEILNFKLWLRSRAKVRLLKGRIERITNPSKKFPLP